jgi:hypothetical protein
MLASPTFDGGEVAQRGLGRPLEQQSYRHGCRAHDLPTICPQLQILRVDYRDVFYRLSRYQTH